MEWPNVLARFASLFAESLASGDHQLAARFAGIAFGIKEMENGHPCDVRYLFDLLEENELANLEVRELRPLRSISLKSLAEDFEDLLAEHRHSPGSDCGEKQVRYIALIAPSPRPNGASPAWPFWSMAPYSNILFWDIAWSRRSMDEPELAIRLASLAASVAAERGACLARGETTAAGHLRDAQRNLKRARAALAATDLPIEPAAPIENPEDDEGIMPLPANLRKARRAARREMQLSPPRDSRPG